MYVCICTQRYKSANSWRTKFADNKTTKQHAKLLRFCLMHFVNFRTTFYKLTLLFMLKLR